MASMVPTPLLNPREYGLIGWADHLTLASTNRSMTLEMAGSSEIGRCVLSVWDGNNLGHLPSSGQLSL